jgi:hypothetical protein
MYYIQLLIIRVLDRTLPTTHRRQVTTNNTSIPFFLSFFPHKSRQASTIPACCHLTNYPRASRVTVSMQHQQLQAQSKWLLPVVTPLVHAQNLGENLQQTVDTRTWSIDSNSCNHLSIGVIRVKRQWITTAHLQCDCLCWDNGLEHAHHVVMRETQHTRLIDIDQYITWFKTSCQVRTE